MGVNEKDILEIRKPQLILKKLINKQKKDVLLIALENLLELLLSNSNLNYENFGVFGSLLMGFYHPNFSDLDLTIYGKENFDKLVKALEKLYKNENSLSNEFDTIESLTLQTLAAIRVKDRTAWIQLDGQRHKGNHRGKQD